MHQSFDLPKEIRLNVEVTEDDIKEGVKKNCFDCPWAIATKRALRAVYPDTELIVRTENCVTYLELPDPEWGTYPIASCENPDNVYNFIRDFDYGGASDVFPDSATLIFYPECPED
jgi:hypothetical protein